MNAKKSDKMGKPQKKLVILHAKLHPFIGFTLPTKQTIHYSNAKSHTLA